MCSNYKAVNSLTRIDVTGVRSLELITNLPKINKKLSENPS
jgi:hypothetical protein